MVLVISMFRETKPDELWLAFDTWIVPIHEVVASMDPRICATLPIFHALTGCETVSAFCGRGKKTAWNTWQVYPKLPRHLKTFSFANRDQWMTMATLEWFVVLRYDCTSDIMNVNDSRKYLLPRTRSASGVKWSTVVSIYIYIYIYMSVVKKKIWIVL